MGMIGFLSDFKARKPTVRHFVLTILLTEHFTNYCLTSMGRNKRASK
jgi:hypothetical protein